MNHKYAIGLGFSSACNMNCSFCYSKEKRNKGKDIDVSIWQHFFEKNNNYINSINYGTGENTTSENWYKLVSFIRESFPNIRQALTTNGYLYVAQKIDDKKRRTILSCIDEVDVSLDFGDTQQHNQYRGNPKAFEWAISTLAFCQDNGILPTIVTLGIDQTLEIENMSIIFNIAQTYGAKVRINLYRPVNKESNIVPASLESILNFFDWVASEHEILAINDPLFSSLLCAGNTIPDPSGQSSLRITQDGNIYPSTYLLFDAFLIDNILTFDMSTNLKNNSGVKKMLNAPIPNDCVKCKFVESCRGGVLDRRYIWYGDYNKRDPYCFIEDRDKFRNFEQKKDGLISVHDGYLPTLFFNP